MNIQRKNSAHHFRMQSEREQTLVVTSTLCDQIVNQDENYDHNLMAKQIESKSNVCKQIPENSTMDTLSDSLQRSVEQAMKRVPYTFTLHKATFHDALAMRYGWTPN